MLKLVNNSPLYMHSNEVFSKGIHKPTGKFIIGFRAKSVFAFLLISAGFGCSQRYTEVVERNGIVSCRTIRYSWKKSVAEFSWEDDPTQKIIRCSGRTVRNVIDQIARFYQVDSVIYHMPLDTALIEGFGGGNAGFDLPIKELLSVLSLSDPVSATCENNCIHVKPSP